MQESLIIILNLILIEGILSIDNAAVLAIMVKHLPEKEQGKALKRGIRGAYLMRGTCLFIAAWLIKILRLKLLGGLYLLYLFVSHFRKSDNEDNIKSKQLGFRGTVAMVEVMDLTFSIDNVFAAVALSKNILIVIIGVFIGILAMRFCSQGFIILMKKYPFLENIAYIVIGLLGFKLVGSYLAELTGVPFIIEIFNGHMSDLYTSILTISLFVFPILFTLLFRKNVGKNPLNSNVKQN